MKNLKTLFFFLSLGLYYFFFWEEKLGLNLLMFNVALLAFNYSQMPKGKKTFMLIAEAVLSSISVILVNTEFNKAVNILIMFVVVGYKLLPTINSAFSAGIVFSTNILRNLRYIAEPISSIFERIAPKSIILAQFLKIVKISLLPIALFGVFFLIFQNANPIFLEKTIFLQNWIDLFFEKFPSFSIPRLIYTVVGYIFLLGVFFYRDFTFGKEYLTQTNIFVKTLKEASRSNFFQTYTISLVVVNLLLLFVNTIDVQYLWFNFAEITAPELSKLVHNGTYLLILSILISIAILLFFFKGELNFHAKNKLVVTLALVWIFQNAILLGSVFIRNYKYAEMYGLTHKRIGVSIFLLLTLVGLITLAYKIIKKLNINFLIATNSWAYMIIFLCLSFFNFDNLIAKDNLQRPNCDLVYVKSLSTRAIPAILKYHPEIKKEDINSYKYYLGDSKKHTWLSWNLPDSELKNLK